MSRIPAGSQTYSKARSQRSANSPTYAVRGDGASVLCSDGKRYTDWTAALGPIVLGYHNEKVDAAVKLAVELGPNFGLPTEYEERVAEQLVRVIPCAERVRFGKNGSDATSAAVRAARALTGRELIVSQGYHGWSLEVGGGPNKNGTVGNGLVDELMGRFGVFGWSANDLPAAIIVEPDAIEINSGNPSGTLEDLRKVCGKVGAVLIFDEVLTGFRLAPGGAQQHYGVPPALACFSKAMGAASISAIVGSSAQWPLTAVSVIR